MEILGEVAIVQEYSSFGLYRWAELFPDKVAVDDGRMSLTYRELAEKVDMLAAGMKNEGVKKGDKVFVSIPNFAEFIIILFACVRLGSVVICGNLQFKDQELDYLTGLMGQPKLAFMNRAIQREIMERAFPELKIVTIDEKDESLEALGTLFAAPTEVGVNMFSLDNDMLVVFTSGSTGVPKGVELTVRNMLIPMCDLIERFHADSEEVLFVPVPFCQTSGMAGILIAMLLGGKLVTATRFDGMAALELIEKHRVSLQFCVTTMYAREIDAYNSAAIKPDISSLRTGTIGGGPVVKEYMTWFEENADCRLLNFYGMTECAGMIAGDFEDSPENRLNKGGRPCRHVTVSILGGNGEKMPVGEQGEICCKSPGVTRGYYKNPEMTLHLIDADGWLHSGDIGIMDSEGYISVIARKKEMIIRGGYNVFPAEVENLYCRRDDVLLAAMLSYPDGDLGEKIAVFLQMKNANHPSAEEIREYAAAHLAKFKVPDKVLFIAEMPMLPSGKVDRVKLTEHLQKQRV